jgi:hypothetical protein
MASPCRQRLEAAFLVAEAGKNPPHMIDLESSHGCVLADAGDKNSVALNY